MTALLVQEDTTNSHKVKNSLGAYLNATYRSEEAGDKHSKLFDTDEHVDRINAVSDIIKDFFGHRPDYYTKRGLGSRTPFEAIKVCDAGIKLKRTSIADKNAKLYEPLLALGNVQIKADNGHLIVRVF